MGAGEEVLFTWAQWLRDQEDLWEDPDPQQVEPDEATASDHEGAARDSNGSVSAGQSTGTPEEREETARERDGWGSPGGDPRMGSGPIEIMNCPRIVHGEPLTERKSTFQVRWDALSSPPRPLTPSTLFVLPRLCGIYFLQQLLIELVYSPISESFRSEPFCRNVKSAHFEFRACAVLPCV